MRGVADDFRFLPTIEVAHEMACGLMAETGSAVRAGGLLAGVYPRRETCRASSAVFREPFAVANNPCGVPVTPQTNRVTLSELLDDVLTDYRVNGKRSATNVAHMVDKHVRPYFGARKAAGITTADVRTYIDTRQAAEAKNATINRELSAIKRAFSLGLEAGKVTHKPKIPMLRETTCALASSSLGSSRRYGPPCPTICSPW